MNISPEKLAAMNSWENRVRAFKQIAEGLVRASDPIDAWKEVLEITQQSDVPVLHRIDLGSDIRSVSLELSIIFTKEPRPPDLTFFYFGLVDLWNEMERKEKAGLYVSGGTETDAWQAIAEGKISYLPQNRWLSTTMLNKIKEAERQVPERRGIMDYAVMFGTAGIIAKFALAALDIRRPVYVGFDSGDYDLVSN